jgi:hypothetical protein
MHCAGLMGFVPRESGCDRWLLLFAPRLKLTLTRPSQSLHACAKRKAMRITLSSMNLCSDTVRMSQ